MALTLTSSAFAEGHPIPLSYTCDGMDIAPPLAWSKAPAHTQSFALIMDDPDAPGGTWAHWVLFNLPPQVHELPQQVALPKGSRSGTNSWGKLGYEGPCPPLGTHRYYFRLYALDTLLGLSVGASKEQVVMAMQRHVLSQAQLIGTYSRAR